ncbi:regulatory LuxR family protein [Roseiarcus fermentans]|uniref:Regulatory LuxR family protein n=1 Tax=Roseiarcus fermentans TaxID=1473586 RepID=A0A366F3I0_9HYPH|nr:LuxR C-terminal-related transcriptional regulator [Roseiarcus fermentans]RBP08540.1 regulatory LuxR family protein [Roseiarcus fermentans]
MSISITPPRNRSGLVSLGTKYSRLLAVIEKSARAAESGARTTSPDVLDLQRRAIASLQESAEIAVSLAERLGDTCPRDITCLHLGDWNRCNSCFDEQAGRFFEQAGKYLAAITTATDPTPIINTKGRTVQKSCDAFPERAASFTEAQQRVFDLLVTGLPNKLIAYEIGVSEATIKAHVSAVLRKLRVRSRAQAIALSSAFERTRNGEASSSSLSELD